MVYGWKPGFHPAGPAQPIGERLEQLRRDHKGLTADVVVRDARPKSSVLHAAFEWDDRKAAEEHRLRQARDLIAHVVILEPETKSQDPIRAFVVVSDTDGDQTYTSIRVAMKDPILRAQVLQRAKRELADWRRRYSELEEFAALFSVIDGAAGEVA